MPSAAQPGTPGEASQPQQARSRATRQRLLAAAVASLVERGHARTSTTEVCRRAGVSQGALFKHFPSKALLLRATAEYLFSELVGDFRRAFARIAGDREDRISAAVRVLDRTYREPRLQAAFELIIAARTDRELAAALAPVMHAHRANLQREARELFPEAAERNPDFASFVDIVLDTMQGRALSAPIAPDPKAEVRQLVALYRLARRELEPSRPEADG